MITLGKGSLLAADMFAKSRSKVRTMRRSSPRTAEYLGVGKGSQAELFQMNNIVT